MNVKLTESPRFALIDVRSAGNTDINAPAVENIQYTYVRVNKYNIVPV